MTNKMPVVGKRYRNKEHKTNIIVKLIKDDWVVTKGFCKIHISNFWDCFEELPDSNSQETEGSEVERALEESKRILRERYSNPEYGQELLEDTLINLVRALEDGKIKSGRGIAEYTPSDFMKHMERCEDALKNMPKPEPKIKTGTITASDVSKAWEDFDKKIKAANWFPSAENQDKNRFGIKPSIWKDVSELLEYQNYHVIGKMKDGKCIFGFPYQLKDGVSTIRNIDNIGGNDKIYFKCFSTLTDFVNQVEDMEARLRKLEGK